MSRPDVGVMRELLARVKVADDLERLVIKAEEGRNRGLLAGRQAAHVGWHVAANLPTILAALRSTGTGRSEAEDELRRHWHDFCDADPTPDGFVERMEAAGLAEHRGVNRDDLEDPFAAEKGIYKGGSLWALTPAGRTSLNPRAREGEGDHG